MLEQQSACAYIPAFADRFAFASGPESCADAWRSAYLRSRMRGRGVFHCLAAALRLLNRIALPSVRRTVTARAIECRLYAGGESSLRSDIDFRKYEPTRPAWEWYRQSEDAIRILPAPDRVPGSLESLESLAEGATLYAVGSNPERTVIELLQSTGCGAVFARSFGRESGDMLATVSRTISEHRGSMPILVIGSTYASMTAARCLGASFYPIVPGAESASWEPLGRGWSEGLADGRLVEFLSSMHCCGRWHECPGRIVVPAPG